jgi:hypothetical protein
MADTTENVLSKWAALKSPKGLIAAALAVAAALGGAVYMGEGFTITVSTCEAAPEAATEAPEAPEAPEAAAEEEPPEVAPEVAP